MKYPIAYLLPVLMLADYYLTLLGYVLYQRYYQKYVETEHYELNPAFQSDIKSKKYFSVRHWLGVVFMLVVAVAINRFFQERDLFVDGAIGALFAVYSIIIGGHLANILTFRKVGKNAEAMSGQMKVSYPLSLRMSQYRLIVPAALLAVMAAMSGSAAVIGGLAGAGFMALMHERWLEVYSRKVRSETGTEMPLLKRTLLSRLAEGTFVAIEYGGALVTVAFTLAIASSREYFIAAAAATVAAPVGTFIAATFYFRRRRGFAVLVAAFIVFLAVMFATYQPQ
jgi:hypothetical protein